MEGTPTTKGLAHVSRGSTIADETLGAEALRAPTRRHLSLAIRRNSAPFEYVHSATQLPFRQPHPQKRASI